MAAAKKPARKRKIQASEVEVGNRTLEGVLTDLATVSKECAVRSARAEERAARAEELAQIALENIGALLRDFRAYVERTDQRVTALEKAAE